jgi:hypothetical protein
MSKEKKDQLLHDHDREGVDPRGFLKCLAWAAPGALCVMQGGVLKSYNPSRMLALGPKAKSILTERKQG